MDLPVIMMLSAASIILCISDFKSRSVSAQFLALYAIAAVVYGINMHGIYLTIVYSVVGGLLSVVMFLFICGYYMLKEGIDCTVIDKRIGKGDLYFFLFSTFIFGPSELVIFYILSGISGLVYYGASKKDDIPLIGTTAPLIVLYIIIDNIF